MSFPRVSVLIACHNHEAFVEKALSSIADQNFDDFELIITDDASTDNTVAVIENWLRRTGFQAQVIFNTENKGLCRVRNDALAIATGEFVCLLDADDWSEPNRLSAHYDVISSQPSDVAFVYGDVREVDTEGHPVPAASMKPIPQGIERLGGDIFMNLLQENFIRAPNVMVRRRAIDAIGGFDEGLYLDDLDLWLRLTERFRGVYSPGILVNYRVWPQSMSHSPSTRFFVQQAIVSTLTKRVGHSAEADRVIAKGIRNTGLNMRVLGHREGADSALRAAQGIRPSVPWQLIRWGCKIPGVAPAIRAAQISRAFVRTRLRPAS